MKKPDISPAREPHQQAKIFYQVLRASKLLSEDANADLASFELFMETFAGLNHYDQLWVRDTYFMSKVPVMALCIHANMGNSNAMAAQMLDFMLSNGLLFNKADRNWLHAKNWFEFEQRVSPLEEVFSKLTTKLGFSSEAIKLHVYVVHQPSECLREVLHNHHRVLPLRLQALLTHPVGARNFSAIPSFTKLIHMAPNPLHKVKKYRLTRKK